MREIVTNKLTEVSISDSRRECTFALHVVAHGFSELNELFLVAVSEGPCRYRK